MQRTCDDVRGLTAAANKKDKPSRLQIEATEEFSPYRRRTKSDDVVRHNRRVSHVPLHGQASFRNADPLRKSTHWGGIMTDPLYRITARVAVSIPSDSQM